MSSFVNLRNMKAFSLFVALLFCTAGLVQADAITNVDSVAMINYEDATVSLGQFDSGLGTLTGVYIEFTTALYDADYQFDNDSSTRSRTFTLTLTSDTTGYFSTDFSLTGTGINPDGSDLFISAFHNFTLAANDGDASDVFNVGGADYGQWSPGTLSATASGYVDSSAFSDFIGTGNLTATVNSEILSSYTSYSDVWADNTEPTGSFSAKVIYEFQAVPEPAAVGLLGLGCLVSLITKRLLPKKWVR